MTTDDNKLDYYLNGIAFDALEKEKYRIVVEDSNAIEFFMSTNITEIENCNIVYTGNKIIRKNRRGMTERKTKGNRLVDAYAEAYAEKIEKGYTKE